MQITSYANPVAAPRPRPTQVLGQPIDTITLGTRPIQEVPLKGVLRALQTTPPEPRESHGIYTSSMFALIGATSAAIGNYVMSGLPPGMTVSHMVACAALPALAPTLKHDKDSWTAPLIGLAGGGLAALAASAAGVPSLGVAMLGSGVAGGLSHRLESRTR